MDRHNNPIATLIMAAGASTRMGRIKQLLPWRNTTLLGNAIRNAKAVAQGEVIVVLGSNAVTIQEKIEEEHVVVIKNENWKLGLGASIACGIQALQKKNTAVVIMLADQPLVDSNFLNTLIDSFSKTGKGIVATSYGNRTGVPAIFDKAYFTELEKLSGEYGAKDVLKRYKNEVLSFDPKGKARDVDTIDDYNLLIKSLK